MTLCLATSPSHYRAVRSGREVARSSAGQRAQRTVVRHAAAFRAIVAGAEHLCVADGGRPAAAVRMDMVDLQLVDGRAPPAKQQSLLAATSSPLQDEGAIDTSESSPRITRGEGQRQPTEESVCPVGKDQADDDDQRNPPGVADHIRPGVRESGTHGLPYVHTLASAGRSPHLTTSGTRNRHERNSRPERRLGS